MKIFGWKEKCPHIKSSVIRVFFFFLTEEEVVDFIFMGRDFQRVGAAVEKTAPVFILFP